MDTSVSHKLMKSETADFTTDWVECRDDDSLWSVIDNDFHTTRSLKGTDVTTLTSDDTTFHFVIINVEYADRVFHCCLSSHTLNGLYYYLLCLLVSIQFCLVHYLIDVSSRIGTCLILKTFHESCACLISRKARKLFQFLTLFELELFEFFLLESKELLLIIHTLLELFYLLTATSQLFLTLIKVYLALLQTVFTLLNLLIALLHFLFELALLVDKLLLYLKELLLFQYVSLLFGGIYHLIIFSF